MRVSPLCLLAFVVVAVACASSAETTPGSPAVDAGPPTVSPEACGTRCVAKAQSCGAPATQAGQICASICATAVTEAQAACLEGKSCVDLIAAGGGATLSTICPGLDPAPASPSGPTSVPSQLTIAAAIPDGYLVRRTDAGSMRSSLFNIAGPPIFLPAPGGGALPSLAKRVDATVLSPPRNGCESIFNVTISATQLAVSTSGVDVLPDTKCADFIDAVAARGVTLTFDRVAWSGSTETSTVTVVLRRLSSN